MPSLVRPPFAALVATALDEGEIGGVGDRRAADQVVADVGAVARTLVVVGEGGCGRADRARAGRDLDQLEAGVALGCGGCCGRRAGQLVVVEAGELIIAKCLELGGSVTGEHGVGVDAGADDHGVGRERAA